MIIKNPTNEKISVLIKGVSYTVEAEGTINNVPEEHARYWQENLHKFIILRKEKEIVSEVIEIPQPSIEAVEPEPVEEESVEEIEVLESEEVSPEEEEVEAEDEEVLEDSIEEESDVVSDEEVTEDEQSQ